MQVLLLSHDFNVLQRWQEACADWRVTEYQSIQFLPERSGQVWLIDKDFPHYAALRGDKRWPHWAQHNRLVLADSVPSDDCGLEFLQAGGVGYCHTFSTPALLRQILEIVAAGEMWVGRSLMQRLLQSVHAVAPIQPKPFQLKGLSEREVAVVSLVAEGMANKEIADRLGITVRTVKAHLTTIFSKLDVRDRLQLVAKLR